MHRNLAPIGEKGLQDTRIPVDGDPIPDGLRRRFQRRQNGVFDVGRNLRDLSGGLAGD